MMQILQSLIGISDPQQIINLDTDSFQNLDSLHFFWKDKLGRYLGGNHHMAKALGFNNIDEMLKLTDFDLCCLSKNEASNLRENDQAVLKTEKSKIVVEPVTLFGDKKAFCISHKAPLRTRSKKIIGIVGFSFVLARGIKTFVNEIPLNEFNNMFQSIHSLTRKKCVTKRQRDCLYYLLKGMTAKQIAKTLNLSHRTVEDYLQTVKNNLNCSSRYELIDKVLKLELHYC